MALKKRSRPPTMPKPNVTKSEENIIKVLISTDNHLGYLEKDPVRGEDSFRAFEEVLELAKSNDADMVLLGGDLFHDNKPSRSTLLKAMRILRKACFSSDGNIKLAVRSDETQINYRNSTIAVSLPVFVIHGNHDDPTGATGLDALSALDILSEAGLITYFGKHSSAKKIQLDPILLTKGRSALALYGLGNVRDEILYHTWAKENNVKFLTPMKDTKVRETQRHDITENETDEEEDNNNDNSSNDGNGKGADNYRWFSLLVLHQNRVTRGTSKGISETLIPRWMDYVVWGHEHDSYPELTCGPPPVVQPGSTVATSLSSGESRPKHAVLLKIRKGQLNHKVIPLQTYRLLRFHDISLSEVAKRQQENNANDDENDDIDMNDENKLKETDPKSVVKYLENLVKELCTELETEFDSKLSSFQNRTFNSNFNEVQYPSNSYYINKLSTSVRQPLIRCRVEISGNWEVPNPQRFGQSFMGRIANASDIISFYRSKKRFLKRTKTFLQGYSANPSSVGIDDESDENDDNMLLNEDVEQKEMVQIPKLVQYYLYHSKAGGTGLKFLELDRLTGAVDHFVNKEESRAITDYVSGYLKVQQTKSLKDSENDTDVLDEDKMLEKFRQEANLAAKRVMEQEAQKVENNKEDQEEEKIEKEQEEKEDKMISDDEIDQSAKSKLDKSKKIKLENCLNDDDDVDDDDIDEITKEHKCKDELSIEKYKKPSTNVMSQDEFEKLVLDPVHTLVTSNKKLAAHLSQKQNQKASGDVNEDLDSNEDGDDDYETSSKPVSTKKSTARPARGRGRGRGRGRASRGGTTTKIATRTIESFMSSTPRSGRKTRANANESVLVPDSDEDQEENNDIQPQTKTNGRTRATRSSASQQLLTRKPRQTRAQQSIMVASDNNDDDDVDDDYEDVQQIRGDADKEEEEEEAYTPLNRSSRKRRATSDASNRKNNTRASQRQRTETRAQQQSAGRSSSFAGRARVRKHPATIDVDEASGDDAM